MVDDHVLGALEIKQRRLSSHLSHNIDKRLVGFDQHQAADCSSYLTEGKDFKSK
jgi:hypothetical protein